MLVPALRRIELDGRSIAFAALRRSRSGSKRSLPPLVSLRRGMGSLTDAVADQLGDSIRLGVGVDAIESVGTMSASFASIPPARGRGSSPVGADDAPDTLRGSAGRRAGSGAIRWRVRCDDGSTLEADAVIAATPPAVTARLLEPLAPTTAAEVAAMPWGSSTTVGLTWAPGQVDLDMGTGYLVPAGEGGVVAACTFTTAKWDHRSADGSTMVRCFMRGEGVDSMTDEDLVGAARDELRRRVGVTASPTEASVRRVPVALPVMQVGHRARVRAIHAGLDGLDGLALAGGGLEGAGLPACIRSGHLAAERVLAALASEAPSAPEPFR
jgi:oxygen-dependent protoporphyrinogen oxidase